MKKIVMIFAAMAAVLSSCTKNEIEPVLGNEDKDIVLNISVSDPGADTKVLIKTGWAENDEISIWYDTNADANPDLVITYNGTKWIQKAEATVSGKAPSTGDGKYAKALYNGTVKVASKDNYTYDGTTLTFNIKNWKFLTEVQVVVKGLTGTASNYTLSCDKFTPLATGNGYTVGTNDITASNGTKASAVTGIANETNAVAFVFATAEYSTTAADYKFALTDNTSSPAVTKVYTANTSKINGTAGSMTAIKALTIASTKFAALYVEIAADYDNDPSTPNTTLKWYRQNLAISDSGKKVWKGGNTGDKPEVKVPGTNENVIVGDYFQWAAYAGYSITDQSQERGLLLYTSFDNMKCDDDANDTFYTNGSTFSKNFNKSNAPHGGTSYSKYNATDEKTKLDASDDVANFILGDNWRMPTSAEFQAMRKATYWAWDVTDCGYYVYAPQEGDAGKKNKDTIHTYNKSAALLFFPAAGYGNGTSLNNAGSYGRYWSSSLNPSNTDFAYYLDFRSTKVDLQYTTSRYYGFSVRPVSD